MWRDANCSVRICLGVALGCNDGPRGVPLATCPSPPLCYWAVLVVDPVPPLGERVAGLLTGLCGPAAVERVSLVALGAGADGLVVGDLALGAGAAGAHTRVGTAQFEAGLVAGALAVVGTLRVAAGLTVPLVVLRTAADGTVVERLTVRTLTAGALRADVTAPVLKQARGEGGLNGWSEGGWSSAEVEVTCVMNTEH